MAVSDTLCGRTPNTILLKQARGCKQWLLAWPAARAHTADGKLFEAGCALRRRFRRRSARVLHAVHGRGVPFAVDDLDEHLEDGGGLPVLGFGRQHAAEEGLRHVRELLGLDDLEDFLLGLRDLAVAA